jgi:hypothetical protein
MVTILDVGSELKKKRKNICGKPYISNSLPCFGLISPIIF